MTSIGWVGLGKLGLPCALALADKGGHIIYGYDIAPENIAVLHDNPFENGLSELSLDNLTLCSTVADVVREVDIVFCAVQTPHDSAYGGETLMPTEKKDFNYTWLSTAAKSISAAAAELKKNITLVIISTALPGSMDTYIKPVLNTYVDLVYNPFFIAMGTTINDFLNPEFVLVGHDNFDNSSVNLLKSIYSTVHDRPVCIMDIK